MGRNVRVILANLNTSFYILNQSLIEKGRGDTFLMEASQVPMGIMLKSLTTLPSLDIDCSLTQTWGRDGYIRK